MRTAALRPTPAMPPAAVTEIRRIVALFVVPLSSVTEASVFLPAATSLSAFLLTSSMRLGSSSSSSSASFFLTRGLFSLSMLSSLPTASSGSYASEPEEAFTIMLPPAFRTAPVFTSAFTLEWSTATVTPAPTPAVPPTATVPEITKRFGTSEARTEILPEAVTWLPVPMVAEVESLRF